MGGCCRAQLVNLLLASSLPSRWPSAAAPCSLRSQSFSVASTADASALAVAVSSYTGGFFVDWTGVVVVEQTIYVLNGTILNVTDASASSSVVDVAKTQCRLPSTGAPFTCLALGWLTVQLSRGVRSARTTIRLSRSLTARFLITRRIAEEPGISEDFT